jgi:hypothetical protein
MGKSLSPYVWYPMSRVSLHDSVNPKTQKVGIAEENPRQLALSLGNMSVQGTSSAAPVKSATFVLTSPTPPKPRNSVHYVPSSTHHALRPRVRSLRSYAAIWIQPSEGSTSSSIPKDFSDFPVQTRQACRIPSTLNPKRWALPRSTLDIVHDRTVIHIGNTGSGVWSCPIAPICQLSINFV